MFLVLTHPFTHTHTQTHTHTDTQTHSHTNGAAIRSNFGFSILPEDTLTCGLDEPGIKPPTLWLIDSVSSNRFLHMVISKKWHKLSKKTAEIELVGILIWRQVWKWISRYVQGVSRFFFFRCQDFVWSGAGPSLEPVCMTHPNLSSWNSSPLKSNPTAVTSGLPNIIQWSPWCDENNISYSCSLSADLIPEEAPISVHSVCLASGSSLSTWHYLNLAVSSPCLHPSVPQTHRLGSDFQITLGESSRCWTAGRNRRLRSKKRNGINFRRSS